MTAVGEAWPEPNADVATGPFEAPHTNEIHSVRMSTLRACKWPLHLTGV